jgi:hypothetical protein
MNSKPTRLLLSVLIVGTLAGFAALSIFGVFTATTQNAGNEISTGTVALTDNDSGSALFNVTGAKPGDGWTRCIKVTYNGTLPADVHLYQQNISGPLANYMTLTMTQGTQPATTFPSCTNFTPDATGIIYSGSAASIAPGSFDYGLPVVPAGQARWQPGDSLVFKFELALDPAAPDAVQSSTTASQTEVWEAHSS